MLQWGVGDESWTSSYYAGNKALLIAVRSLWFLVASLGVTIWAQQYQLAGKIKFHMAIHFVAHKCKYIDIVSVKASTYGIRKYPWISQFLQLLLGIWDAIITLQNLIKVLFLQNMISFISIVVYNCWNINNSEYLEYSVSRLVKYLGNIYGLLKDSWGNYFINRRHL